MPYFCPRCKALCSCTRCALRSPPCPLGGGRAKLCPPWQYPTVEFMGEKVLLWGLPGGREPGAAHGALAAHGDRGERGVVGAATWACQQQVQGVTRQQNGKVGFVFLLSRPGCGKPYLFFKGRFALKMPRGWVQSGGRRCLLTGCGEGASGVNSWWHCFRRKCSV